MRWLKIKYIAISLPDNKIVSFSKDYIIIPVGKGLLFKEIEELLENAEIGKKYEIALKKPFGERKEENIKIIPINEFKKRNIKPFPGLIVSVDGIKGIVRSINSGRVITDFNHPLAGKDILYEFEILEEINDLKEKIFGILNFFFNIKRDDLEINIENNNIKIFLKKEKIPDLYKEILKKYIDDLKNYNIE